MTALDDLAPWPATGPVTADSLARVFAVNAAAAAALAHALPIGTDAWHEHLTRALDEFGIAFLLRAVAPDEADRVATEMRDHWDDGTSVPELLWEWLEGYGIDPERVRQLATA